VTHWPRNPAPVYLYAHLLDSAGGVWGKLDKEPLDGRYGSMRWPVGVVNTDRFAIAVAADALPGRYVVQVGMYPGDGSGDMAITGEDGKPVDRLLLGPFKVPLPPVQTRPVHEIARSFGDRIALIGYDLDAPTVRPGDVLSVRLYWQALQPVGEDYTYFVHVLDEDGKLVAQCDAQPRGGTYPTSIWDKGEIVPDECRVQLPSLAPGQYALKAGLYGWPSLQRLAVDGGGDSVDLGAITVRAQ